MILDMFGIFLLIAGCFVTWNTGANDAANCIGASVGSGIMKFKYAALLMSVCVFFGAITVGQRVMSTTGTGILITTEKAYVEHTGEEEGTVVKEYFPEERLSDVAILAALIAAGLSVTIATYYGIPLSTSQSIVGAIAGIGVGVVGFQGEFFRLTVLYRIIGSWVISPFLTLIIAFLTYKLMIFLTGKIKKNILRWERILVMMVIATSGYFSFNLGANAFGAGLGPLLNRFPGQEFNLALIGVFALALGVFTFGKNVVETVGTKITRLDYAGAFSAQLAAGLGLQFFSYFGIPVSSSQSIVGAVIGVGLVQSARMIDARQIGKICMSWVITPAFAALVALVLYKIFEILF